MILFFFGGSLSDSLIFISSIFFLSTLAIREFLRMFISVRQRNCTKSIWSGVTVARLQ